MKDTETLRQGTSKQRGKRPALPQAAKMWTDESREVKPVKVWVTPQGARLIRVPHLPPPRYFAVLTHADGTEEVLDWPCHVKCSGDLPHLLGLDMDYQTLLRLIKADFVRALQATPRNFLVDLTSLHGFLMAARDPLFWTPSRKEHFRTTTAKGEYL